MSRSSTVPLSTSSARRIWLRAQRLDVFSPFGGGPDATRMAVEHLGYVQIDTIHVIERCHHHILFTRIPNYERAHLHHAQTIDKSVFEYRTHALSYVPTRDLRFYVAAMKAHRTRPTKVTTEELRKVMTRVKKHGAMTIRDVDDDVLIDKDHEWASRKPSKRALELAFCRGDLVIGARIGMLKTYELTGRHFGALPKAATEQETLGYLLDRALRSQGIVSLDSVCHLDAPRKPAIQRLIETRLRRRELVAVELDGAGMQTHWLHPETLDTSSDPGEDLVHILSPFDPLVIQRKPLKLLFGYEHRFEAYVPKEKRTYGYFALPVLIGEEIVAILDLKTDRAARKLLIQQWTWVGKGMQRERKKQIETALHRFERFQLAR